VPVVAAGTTRYVVLLRGINVGKARQVDMGRLREVLTARGSTGVRTHLRSGNVVLDSALTEPELVRDAEEAIRAEFGMDVPVVVRTGEEVAAVLAADPLGGVARDPARYLVTFLPAAPDDALVAALPAAPEGEAHRVVGRELYQWLPGGISGSGMTDWPWGRLLGQVGTARNWNTVTKLAELAAPEGAAR
jgi:uncharacterized protein (DUF1697 family)